MSEAVPVRHAATALAFDDRPFPKRIGLVVLATDHTSEADFNRLVASEGAGVHVARIAYANPTTPNNLRRMQPSLEAGAALILPDEQLDALCYSCTSASVVIGDDVVEAALAAAKPGTPIVTPPSAAVHALRRLGARRLSILTPYTAETSAYLCSYFARHGFDIVGATCFGLEDDREMARIQPASLAAAAVGAIAPAADALFISCTALRSVAVVHEVEQAVGRPVVTSNLATAWRCLDLCGLGRPRTGLGRLFALPQEG